MKTPGSDGCGKGGPTLAEAGHPAGSAAITTAPGVSAHTTLGMFLRRADTGAGGLRKEMALGARGSLSIGGDSNPRGGVGLPSVGGGGAQRRRERLLARRSLGLGSNEVNSARAAHSACLALVQAALASGWSDVWSSGGVRGQRCTCVQQAPRDQRGEGGGDGGQCLPRASFHHPLGRPSDSLRAACAVRDVVDVDGRTGVAVMAAGASTATIRREPLFAK